MDDSPRERQLNELISLQAIYLDDYEPIGDGVSPCCTNVKELARIFPKRVYHQSLRFFFFFHQVAVTCQAVRNGQCKHSPVSNAPLGGDTSVHSHESVCSESTNSGATKKTHFDPPSRVKAHPHNVTHPHLSTWIDIGCIIYTVWLRKPEWCWSRAAPKLNMRSVDRNGVTADRLRLFRPI